MKTLQYDFLKEFKLLFYIYVFIIMLLFRLGALYDHVISKEHKICGSCPGKAAKLQTRITRYDG